MRIGASAAVLVALCVLGAGCGGSGGKPTSLVGYAFAGGPLIGAKVTFLDSSGKEIGQAATRTTRHGLFTARLKLPANFTVVASGGKDRGRPFTKSLRAEQEHYDSRVIDVNPATTLESMVRARGHLSHARAVRVVRHYLRLPAGTDYTRGARLSRRYVSTAKLVDKGNLDQIVKDALAGKTKSWADTKLGDPAGAAVEDAAESSVDQVLGGLANGAGSEAGSWAMGQLLSAMGANTSPDTAALQQIESQLNQLQTDFNQLEAQFTQIEKALNVIQYNQATSDLYNWVADNPLTTSIQNGLYDKYVALAQAIEDDGPTSSNAQNAKTAFENAIAGVVTTSGQVVGINGVTTTFVNIGTDVGGQGAGTNVALTDWENKFVGQRFWGADDQTAYRSAFDYWAGIEAELAPMIQDYDTANNISLPSGPVTVDGFLPDQPGDSAINTASAFAAWRQAAGLDGLQPIPAGYIVDAATHTMWPQDLATTIVPNTITWLDANTKYVDNNFANAGLPSGFTWELPSNQDFVNLVSAYGAFTAAGDSWTDPQQPNIAQFLANNGFNDVFEYFWISDTFEAIAGTDNNLTVIMRQSFSMKDGSTPWECWAYQYSGVSWQDPPPPYCGDDTEVHPVSLTAVAHLDETPTNWWAPPSATPS